MSSTKLLTILLLSFLLPLIRIHAQCSLITKNGSSQDPKTVCTPVDFTMDVWFKFMLPVDPSLVEIRFVWNDGTGATTTVSGNWNAGNDSVWAQASHIYPPTDECSRTADAYLIYDGDICTSSGHQEQTFSTWGTDEENSGVLTTDPVVAYFCEGEDIVNVTFDDASTFNCNINLEPDNPNRYYRWVQFVYSTYNQAGDRIPSITVDDGSTIHPMTDNAGNFINNLYGPIIRIPIPADGPNQTSYPISAPAGGVAGDIFEIVMRNWNVCNPYDNFPTDAIPPGDIINGDNPPIETTARIEIIAPPPVVVAGLFEFCTTENIILSATAGSAQIRWYADAALTNLLHTGNTYNPRNPPFNLDNTIPGNYTFYVTSREGICESAPDRVDVVIYQSPAMVNAGPDQVICADSIRLNGTVPDVGTGLWSTTGGATIVNPNDPASWATNLTPGNNNFTWTVVNGICQSSDELRIISDRQPDPAFAGTGDSLCNTGSITLNADPPTANGRGHWIVVEGTGAFADTSSPTTHYINPSAGMNTLIWRVSSEFGSCPVSIDSVRYFTDLSPGIANAGPDVQLCQSSTYTMLANPPQNGGSGTWQILSGTAVIDDIHYASGAVSNLQGGDNLFSWQLSSLHGICGSTTDTVTIRRDLWPGTANAGPDISLCLENSDTLGGNPPLYGSGQWHVITNPSGNPPILSPNVFSPGAIISVLPGNEGEYLLEWVLQNGTCISRDTVRADFGIPPPPGFAGNDTTVCGLEATLHSNTFAQGHGIWNQLSGSGTAVFNPGRTSSSPLVSIPPGEEGIYHFEWMLTSGACAPSSDTVQITFLPAPLSPTVVSMESCGPASFNLPAAGPGGDGLVQWFTSPAAPAPFHTGENYITPLLNTSTFYYVNTLDTVTGCESPKTQLRAEIFPVPDAPVLTGDTLCGFGNAMLRGTIVLPANTIQWFNDAAGNNLIGQGSVIYAATGSDRYYWGRAADTLHGCISEIDSVNIIVHPPVPEPGTADRSACGPSDFTLQTTKSESEHSSYWYDSPVAGMLIRIDDSLYLPVADSSRTYWVSEVNDSTGCQSNRVRVDAVIDPIPGTPTLNDTSSCGPRAFVLFPDGDSNTTTFRWYDQPLGGSLVQEADSFYTGLLSSNVTYWASAYNITTTCESPRNQTDISIYPMPSSISVTGPTLVLKDQTDVPYWVEGNTSSTYVWTIPPGVVLEENWNDFVRLSFPNTGSFTLTVYEITANGCIGTPVGHPIMVIKDSIAVDIGLYDQNACTGVSYEIRPYLFGGTPPYTYSWTGDIAYLSDVNSLFTNFSPPGTGTYHLFLQVVDVNLKTAYDSVAITVHTSPSVNILTKDEIVCVGNTLQLELATTGFPAASHLWSGPVHDLSSYTIPDPVYTPRTPDTVLYYYQLTDINGCKAYDSTRIYSDIPVAYFQLETGPGCSPLTVEFNNQSERSVSYQWDLGDGTTTNAEEPVHVFVNQSPEIKYYPVNLEVTSILGCKDNITQYAMVWPNPVATIDAIPEYACSPAEITLFSTPGNLRYYWDYGDGESEITGAFSTRHNFIASSERDELFTVKVITESSLNCIDSAFLNLNIYARPEADFTLSPSTDTFPDNVFEITNLTVGSRWTYDWSLGDGRTLSADEPGRVQYEAPGNYAITLTARSEHCSDSATRTAYLNPAVPQAKFAGPEPGCMPHTIHFINNSEYADDYLWEFGDGSISTAANPSYTYYEAGIYKVRLTVRGAGGEASHSDTARVYIVPNSFFDLAPRYVYVNDEAVHFFNLSDNADKFEWDFGDGSVSDELNPKHIYKKEGTYDITLKVWTNYNCYDLFIMENAVMVEPSGIVDFPNAFRPHSPLEENRVFMPGVIDHVDEYHLMIFNRWGELIFESFDQEIGWDGTYNGQTAKQDVYIWKVKGTYSDGKGFIKTGDVTLMY
jgi:gliding motility-associated-like protein